MMATYLTFLDNKAMAYDESYPDENFAREVMQLFSIGLWKLKEDGSQQLDDEGKPMMTYTNDDIVTFSRAWTGMTQQKQRWNIENYDGSATGGRNDLDPMSINPEWRDPFPKLDLHGGYIGDGFPLCADLPSRAFLLNGTRFSYLGIQAGLPDGQLDSYIWQSYSGAHLVLEDRASPLHQRLCSRAPGVQSGACTLTSEVQLMTDLPCHGGECQLDTARVIKLVDGNVTAYFEWQRPACVELPFYADAKVAVLTNAGARQMCADPATVVAGSCCVDATDDSFGQCHYLQERMTYQTARARCENISATVCASTDDRVTNADCGYKSQYLRHWTSLPCTIKAQVDRNGWVAIVHEPYGKTVSKRPSFAVDNNNIFRVAWRDGLYPAAASNCSSSCTVRAGTCLCDVLVETTRVFDALPSTAAEVVQLLHITAWCPHMFGAATYVLLSWNAEVEWYAKASAPGGGGFNNEAIIKVIASGTCFANKQSMVTVDQFAFRNSPHFVGFLEATAVDAAHETDALLDHLVEHPNVAPFVAHRLIQRFTSSNPSPRYVRTVADAFRTGGHGGVSYSGRYGDLGATMAAVLLDREARSTTLDADPAHGLLREPLLKLHHFLRAMEFVSQDDREIEMPSIEADIGMEAHKSPSAPPSLDARASGFWPSLALACSLLTHRSEDRDPPPQACLTSTRQTTSRQGQRPRHCCTRPRQVRAAA